MNDDSFLALQFGGFSDGRLRVEVKLFSWVESDLTGIRDTVLKPMGLENVNVQQVKVPSQSVTVKDGVFRIKPGEIRITTGKDCIIAFTALMAQDDAVALCRALVSAAMDRFMVLHLDPRVHVAIGGDAFFEGQRYVRKE